MPWKQNNPLSTAQKVHLAQSEAAKAAAQPKEKKETTTTKSE
jgi:hypothetical protein